MAEEKKKLSMQRRIFAVLNIALLLGLLITCFYQGFDAGSIASLALMALVLSMTLMGPFPAATDSESPDEPADE